MKYAFLIASLFAFIGCKSDMTYEDASPLVDSTLSQQSYEVDSMLAKSNASLEAATICFAKSDSATEKIVERKIFERSILRSLTSKEKIVVKTDTVYIETEKSFWGKKKSKVTKVEGDSNVIQLDTVQVDTLN